MNSVHNNQYTSIEMYMCRYVIYKCVAHTSPGLFSSDPVSILRCLVDHDPVSILRCVALPWWSSQHTEVFVSYLVNLSVFWGVCQQYNTVWSTITCFESRKKERSVKNNIVHVMRKSGVCVCVYVCMCHHSLKCLSCHTHNQYILNLLATSVQMLKCSLNNIHTSHHHIITRLQ